MTRLLIIESQPAVRKGLHMRLAAESDLSLIGEAPDCEAGLDLAALLLPDVVLVDVGNAHLLEVTADRALRSICQQAPVIVLGIHDDVFTQECARDAGAAAFVAMSLPFDALLATIRQVARQSLPLPD